MSVHINPCYRCPMAKGCRQRLEFRRRVSRIGLRSAMFDCQILFDRLAPGTRIEIEVPAFEADSAYDGEGLVMHGVSLVKATIVKSKRCEFSCVIDDGEMDRVGYGEYRNPAMIRFRKRMRHIRIKRFLDEPARRVCGFGRAMIGDPDCDRPEGENCECQLLDGKSWGLVRVAA